MIGIFGKLNPLALFIITAILGILFFAVIATIVIRKKYKDIGQALERTKKGEQDVHNQKVLSLIVEEYKATAKGHVDEVNTQAIIEKNFNHEHRGLYRGERFIKHAVSLMIILGLLGTFYGLTLSISKLVELLSSSANAEVLSSMDNIVEGLIESVKGMSVAFVTSLFGIASSIILTIFNIFSNVGETRESLMVQIEEYLDNKVAQEFRKEKVNEYTMIVDALKSTFEQFGGRIEDRFSSIIDVSGENLTSAAKEMETSSMALLKTVQMFDNSIEKFNENTRDFSEFNYNLRTNIERMNVTFADFIEDLKEVAVTKEK